MLTPRAGHTDPPKDFVQQDKFSLEALIPIDKYNGFGQKKTSKSSFQASLFDVFK